MTSRRKLATSAPSSGLSGAGKSSVINALLGEENVVPTSCMRACTSVPTELAWNKYDDPARAYRAAIEFVDEADFRKELELLLEEMRADPSSVKAGADTEAAVTFAKVCALYPTLTKDVLAKVSVDQLLSAPHVKFHLGRVTYIKSSTPKMFYRSLQRYVDTKEKDTDTRAENPLEWWPLIKCVKIYLRAEALSTGAILVDLPGVQDSNAGRAAVADGYMRRCNGIWIVAPITRAVNDKAAKNLLGDQFKRQMKFDGLLSNVTFICSKTDDILIEEAVRSLGLERKVAAAEREQSDHQATLDEIRQEIKEADEMIVDQSDVIRGFSNDSKAWRKMKKQHAKGQAVWAPIPQIPNKRKSTHEFFTKSRKRVQSPMISRTAESSDEDEDDDEALTPPLTDDEIVAKFHELKTKKINAVTKRKELEEGRRTLFHKRKSARKLVDASEDKAKAICIAARNEWSRGRIQDDYASGLKELDQECATEDDEEGFDPSTEIRDYEAAARALPVFCVSSRGYQSSQGRFPKSGKVTGFETIDDTEIPQLMAHCIKMTENNRIRTSRIFLTELTDLLLSLSAWTANCGRGVVLSDKQREKERQSLMRGLKTLDVGLDRAMNTSQKDLRSAQLEHIEKLFVRAVRIASAAALPTAQRWGGPPALGGLSWSSYRAVIKRSGGPFTNARGTHNFNKDLSNLFEKYLASGWENCFQKVFPKKFRSLGKSLSLTLAKFHEKVAEHARSHGIGIAGMQLMEQKLAVWKEKCMQQSDSLIESVSAIQKNASRDITPAIAAMMANAYAEFVQETGTCFLNVSLHNHANTSVIGKGSFMRMKRGIEGHVENEASAMFAKCVKRINGQLNNMQHKVSEQMRDFRNTTYEEFERDYLNAIVGVDIGDHKMTEAQREMRSDLHQLVHEVNKELTELTTDKTTVIMEKDELIKEDGEDEGDKAVQNEQDAEDVIAKTRIDETLTTLGAGNTVKLKQESPAASTRQSHCLPHLSLRLVLE